MSTPGNINLNVSPYYDDYDEDKNFVRVLYRPGRAVQARELTQAQTYQQKQIERFANFMFDDGAIIDGCEISPNLKLNYVKLQSTFNDVDVDINNFIGNRIVGANTGIIAYVNLATDLENDDPKTLFISYASGGGGILSCNTTNQLVVGNEIKFSFPLTSSNTATITSIWTNPTTGNNSFVITGSGNFPTGGGNTITATSTDINGSPFTISISLTGNIDKRSSTTFEESEILICINNANTFYANTASTDATQYVENPDTASEITYTRGSALTVGPGVVYIANHFVKTDTQSIILDKYSNKPSYKVGVIPEITFIDSISDATLVDNAQGTPNEQAPGADRLKINTVLAKYELNDITLDNFVPFIEMDLGIIRKLKNVELGSKLEDAIAQRTYDESGDYTLNDPILSPREHLINGDNGGRYTLANSGNNELLIIDVDPVTAYVKGYRHETLGKAEVNVRKGTDSNYISGLRTQLTAGGSIYVKEVVGNWDINENSTVEIYDTVQGAISNTTFASTTVSGSKIGTARIKSFEYVSGTPGTSSGIYNFYLHDVTMDSGKAFETARSLYLTGSPAKFADFVLDSVGRAVVSDSTFDKLIFKLPYSATKSLRDPSNNNETSFNFKKDVSIELTAGVATAISTDVSETFIGSGTLPNAVKNDYLTLIPTTTSNTSALTGTVTIASNSNTVTGNATSFATQFNIGDIIRVNALDRIVNSISNATHMTLTTTHTGATANTHSKSFPAGVPISLTGFGSAGGRFANVSSSATSLSINIGENATISARLTSSMIRTTAREKSKLLNYSDQVYIQANTHPSLLTGPWSLGKGDVINIRGIYQANDFVSIPTTANTNVTQYYDLDTGQRDNSYEHSTISPKEGTYPTGRLLVVYDSYLHDTSEGTGYFSINSYPVDDLVDSNTTIITSELPVYISSKSRETYNLRDCIDFRLIKTANTTTLNPIDVGTYQIPTTGSFGPHIPSPNLDFVSNLIYYKGRKSKLYITQDGEFKINDGPAQDTESRSPSSIPGTLQLAEISIPPYPSSISDVIITPYKNRRYTMKDMGSIEKRVQELELYNMMNSAEKQIADKVIIDENTGVDRYKNGFLVDVFTGHNVADVNSPVYKASINRHDNYVTAYSNNEMQIQMVTKYNTDPFNMQDSGVNVTTGGGSNGLVGHKVFLLAGDTVVSTANQMYATSNIALSTAPSNWVGNLKLMPATDNWFDTIRVPGKNLVNDTTGQLDNWKSRSDAWNTEINPAVRYFVGDDPKVRALESTGVTSSAVSKSTISELNNSIIPFQEINSATGRVIDRSIQNTMRSRDIVIDARGLIPGTRMYCYFDGIDVTASVTQIALKFFDPTGGPAYTAKSADENGIITRETNVYHESLVTGTSGMFSDAKGNFFAIFRVPAKTFNIGAREFKISNSPTFSSVGETTYAKCTFYTQGSSITATHSILNTRPTNRLSNKSLTSTASGDVESGTLTQIIDPLIQTFTVDPSTYTQGFMIRSVNLYFAAKPAASQTAGEGKVYSTAGVTVDIREMDAITGYPSRNIIGNESVSKEWSQISANTTSPTTATQFTFPNPIYCQPGKTYCIAVKANGNEPAYRLWVAETNKYDLVNTSTKVVLTEQTALYLPSTNHLWTKSKTKDLKFQVIIDKYFNPATASSLTGTYELRNMPTANALSYTSIYPNIETLILPKTDITFEMRRRSDTSPTYFPIKNLEVINNGGLLDISNTTVETAGSFLSLGVRATLTTNDPYISPYIDLQRINCILTKNIINNSTEAELSGTVGYSSSSNVVTGYGTTFETSLLGVKYIKTSTGEYRQISSIANNTSLVVMNNFSTTANGVTLYYNTEENPIGPHTSLSRYITRTVTLNDEFDSSDIVVYLDINRQAGTDIKVYYKILNSSDQEPFASKFWTEMPIEGLKKYTSNPKEYLEQKYVVSPTAKSKIPTLLSGKVTTNVSSDVVTGVNTVFLEDLRVGDTIGIGTSKTEYIVASVANNTILGLTSVATANAAAQDIYRLVDNTISYTTPTGITYNQFKYYAIKVVFLSDNVANTPKVKNLRAIALA